MKFSARMRSFFAKSHQNIAILGSLLISLAILLTPLQRFISLSRPQHYGLAIAVLGTGYLLQAALSWSYFSKWERLCYLTTGIFFDSVGVVFIQNSWLDYKSIAPTPEQEGIRSDLIACYIFLGIVMGSAWMRLVYENIKGNSKKGKRTGDS